MAIFDKTYDKVPDLLKGRILHANGKKFTINIAQGFAKDENDKGVYKPIVTMAPGRVYCPSVQGHVLMLIACRDGMQYGGCVLIREVLSSTGGAFDKPSKVAKALGINAPKTEGEILERPDGDLELKLTVNPGAGLPIHEPKETAPVRRKADKNTFARLMPKITEAWERFGKKVPHRTFVQKLYDTCRYEDELLSALKQ